MSVSAERLVAPLADRKAASWLGVDESQSLSFEEGYIK